MFEVATAPDLRDRLGVVCFAGLGLDDRLVNLLVGEAAPLGQSLGGVPYPRAEAAGLKAGAPLGQVSLGCGHAVTGGTSGFRRRSASDESLNGVAARVVDVRWEGCWTLALLRQRNWTKGS